MSSRKARRRIVLAVMLVLAGPPLAFLGFITWTANLGTVLPGRIYRSGQMTAGALEKTVRELGVKTVLNLRGPNPDHAWYRDERAVTIGAGASLVDIAMSSCQWMSRAQLREVVRVLDEAERPLLVHCQWGSERTGLVSAIAELLRPGATLDDAESQFAFRHMFLRVKDGKIMAGHFDRYVEWLVENGWEHSPESFRRWVDEGFVPESPSREQWPYDPYPLVVVTRPAGPEPKAPAVAIKPAKAPHR